MMPRSCSPPFATLASSSSGNSIEFRSSFWLISVQTLLPARRHDTATATADRDIESLAVFRRISDSAAGGLDRASGARFVGPR
jgi:hypothetical protein